MKTNNILISIASLLLVACGAPETQFAGESTTVYELMARKLNAFKKIPSNLKVEIVEVPSVSGIDTLAYCESNTQGNNRIVIPQDVFKKLTMDAQFQIFAHEYLHCRYGIGHDERSIGNLMSPYQDTDNAFTELETLEAYATYL